MRIFLEERIVLFLSWLKYLDNGLLLFQYTQIWALYSVCRMSPIVVRIVVKITWNFWDRWCWLFFFVFVFLMLLSTYNGRVLNINPSVALRNLLQRWRFKISVSWWCTNSLFRRNYIHNNRVLVKKLCTFFGRIF